MIRRLRSNPKILFLKQRENNFPSSTTIEESTFKLLECAVGTTALEVDFSCLVVPAIPNQISTGDLKLYLDVFRYASQNKCTHIYMPSTYSPIPFFLYVRNTHKFSVSIMTLPVALKHHVIMNLLCRWLVTLNDIFISPSPVVNTYLETLTIPRMHVPHAIDTSRLHSFRKKIKNDNMIVLAYAGKLINEKKIEAIIDVTYKLIQKGWKVKTNIIGPPGGIKGESPGAYFQFLKDYTNKLKLTKFIKFHGIVMGHKKLSILAQADCYLCPSEAGKPFGETFGYGLLESLAIGVPVICSDNGHHRELLKHGGGQIRDYNTDMESIVDAIIAIKKNQLPSCLTPKCFDAAAEYDLGIIAKKMECSLKDIQRLVCKQSKINQIADVITQKEFTEKFFGFSFIDCYRLFRHQFHLTRGEIVLEIEQCRENLSDSIASEIKKQVHIKNFL